MLKLYYRFKTRYDKTLNSLVKCRKRSSSKILTEKSVRLFPTCGCQDKTRRKSTSCLSEKVTKFFVII